MWKIIIFFEIILCVLCVDYIFHIRKIYKIDRENLNDKILKLSENKEKGERFLNVLGIMHVPTVLGMLENSSLDQYVRIMLFLLITAVVIALNCRIYKYTIRIKKLELEQQSLEK